MSESKHAPLAGVTQRAEDDCTICSIAMATGLPYERVIEAARAARMGYVPGKGTRSTYWVLAALGIKSKVLFALEKNAIKPGMEADPQRLLTTCLWGRRAIVTLPSLNGFEGRHDVYWDGHAIHDPTTKPRVYEPDALEAISALEAVILDDASLLTVQAAQIARCRNEVGVILAEAEEAPSGPADPWIVNIQHHARAAIAKATGQ